MSIVKSPIDSMDFKEFEENRKMIINKVKGVSVDEFIRLNCDETATFYNLWLEIGGKHIANERVENQYGGQLIVDNVDEFVEYLIGRFVDWLEGFGC